MVGYCQIEYDIANKSRRRVHLERQLRTKQKLIVYLKKYQESSLANNIENNTKILIRYIQHLKNYLSIYPGEASPESYFKYSSSCFIEPGMIFEFI